MYDETGKEVTNADLDECHGRVSPIPWDGKQVTMYHYVLTREYPYTVGCFRGTALRVHTRAGGPSQDNPPGSPTGAQAGGPDARTGGGPGGGAPDGRPRGPRQPPAEAIAACADLSADSQCRFTSPRGDSITGMCRSPSGALACVPDRR
jgi:hypothetical protein